ncbi:MAG TPA: YfiR family protein [Geomonas sp.]|nr:YfiR family protein [Geomonas sp.]
MHLRHLTALIVALILLVAARAPADTSSYGEYQVKAAFIYNFAKYVEWPADTFESSSDPIVVTILGPPPNQEAFEAMRGKSVRGRRLELRFVKRADEIGTTHILYVCDYERDRRGHVPDSYRNQGVLTINDLDPSGPCGGAVISFVMVDKKLRFQINLKAARKTGLKISSQLLKLARNVVE